VCVCVCQLIIIYIQYPCILSGTAAARQLAEKGRRALSHLNGQNGNRSLIYVVVVVVVRAHTLAHSIASFET